MNLPRLLDSALDRSIVGGYTNVGFRLRRAAWDKQGLPRMDGRHVLITGGAAGLGWTEGRKAPV